MSPARRGGSPCLFPLQLFSLCWVLSVAQSKTVRYSTFEEDAPARSSEPWLKTYI